MVLGAARGFQGLVGLDGCWDARVGIAEGVCYFSSIYLCPYRRHSGFVKVFLCLFRFRLAVGRRCGAVASRCEGFGMLGWMLACLGRGLLDGLGLRAVDVRGGWVENDEVCTAY